MNLVFYAVWKDGEVKGYAYLEPEQAKILNELNLGVYFGFDKHTNPEKYK